MKRTKEDIIFSEIKRMAVSDPCHCQNCKIESPEISNFDSAHIHSRRYTSGGLRWSFSNAVVLCRSCHNMFGAQPARFDRFLLDLLGEGYLEGLDEKLHHGCKVTKPMKKELYKYLKECKEKVRIERLSGNDNYIELTDWL